MMTQFSMFLRFLFDNFRSDYRPLSDYVSVFFVKCPTEFRPILTPFQIMFSISLELNFDELQLGLRLLVLDD